MSAECSRTPLELRLLGQIPYHQAWELQKSLLLQRIAGEISDTLLLCHHPAVITLGKGAREGNVLIPEDTLAQRGIEVVRIERGGDVTFHGPGQLVAYPILDLNQKRRDVGWYMRSLEEVVIRTLTRWQIAGTRVDGKTGVWAPPEEGQPLRKISSIGVKISRWCTMHGIALNVTKECEQGFFVIHPCGFTDISVTSMESERTLSGTPVKIPLKEVESTFTEQFMQVFASQL